MDAAIAVWTYAAQLAANDRLAVSQIIRARQWAPVVADRVGYDAKAARFGSVAPCDSV